MKKKTNENFGDKLIAACESFNEPFGTPDADGWYEWKGDDMVRPVGRVAVKLRAGGFGSWSAESLRWEHCGDELDIVKWRPALPFNIGKCANKRCGDKAREISPYCDRCEPDL